MSNSIKIVGKYLSSFYNFLITAWLLLFIFFVFYEIKFKALLLMHFQNLSDQVSKLYYLNVFTNLEYPIIFTLILLSVVILFYKKIRRFISDIKNDKPFLVLLILISIIIQAIILFGIKTQPIADSKYYIDFGKRLFETGSYIKQNGDLTAFWPVGLPAYLALLMNISPNYIFIAKLVNILISVMFIIILYFLFKEELTVPGRIILLFAVALYPNNLFSVNCIMADYPFAILLWITVYLSLKKGKSFYVFIIAGFILGGMSFLRPVGFLLPVILIIYLIKNRNNEIPVIKSAVLVFTFLLVLSPWITRNYFVFNKLVPISTNGGYNFLMGNHKGSDGGVNFNFSYEGNNNEAVASRNAYYRAFRMIKKNPIESFFRIPEKIFFTYYRGDSSITWALKETRNHIEPVILSFVFFFSNFMFYLVLGISLTAYFVKRTPVSSAGLSYFLSSIYIYFLLIVIVYVGAERYLIPLLPVHFFYTGKYFN